MRQDLRLSGRHQGYFDDGIIDVVYDGEVTEESAHKLAEASRRFPTGNHSVYVADVTKLDGFSPAARKVLSSIENPDKDAEVHTHLFVSGAGIKTKAALALVMAATRLIGKIHYHTVYVGSVEEARRLGREKVKELVATGAMTLPGA